MQPNKLAATLAAVGLAVPATAMATNGMIMEGYGPIASGMGGASMAYDNGTAAMANNPATLGLMAGGSRADVMLGFVGPDVKTPMGTSEADAFYMPAIGWVKKQDKLAYGVGIYGQGGMGTEYTNGDMAQVSVGRVIFPVAYAVNNRFNAVSRLNDIIDPAVRNFITSHKLIEAVRKSNRELDTAEVGLEDQEKKPHLYLISLGREKITQGVLEQAQPKVAQFGIELVDVKIKGINYVEEVRKSVYDRMIAERKQIAEKFRSEGKGEAQKVLGQKERDLQQITSEAYRISQEVKGRADAEAAKIYAEAYGIDPDFYAFTQTLEIYNDSLNKDASLLLSTDSEFLKYFKGIQSKSK
jgi:regulator of protease activity HflC (stomatin/prohibitin superfamily)